MYDASREEQKILEFWEKNKIFERSVEERSLDNLYVFYDGPPFATGLPHYGHIVASTIKDVVPRFWTMRGFRVERRWGWDCHGLPIENIIEKELQLTSRQAILDYGIDKFNEACRATVLTYAQEWKKTIRRLGRWVDMENGYKTMDADFMESVWWVFSSLWTRDLIYQGYKPMHICPRCVTPLSNFEVTQGYKDVKDISVTVQLPLMASARTREEFLHIQPPINLLVWTTTPWTLPGNKLVAVGPDIEYVLIKEVQKLKESEIKEESYYLVARERVAEVFEGKEYVEEGRFKGSELVGLTYQPLFPYFDKTPNAFRVVAADFVTTNEGTGLVHIAPAYGEDDFLVGQREKLPLVHHLTMEGRFTPEVTDFAGQEAKPKEDPTRTDIEIIKWLAAKKALFSKKKIEHSYPHCWRCDTPLLNFATTSWFVRVTQLKDQLLQNNETVQWVPEHIKHGRFGKWLEGSRDWAVSRHRYWGTPLPVWVCGGLSNESDQPLIDTKKCENILVFGSIAELEKAAGVKVNDLHKHIIDELVFPCQKCGGVMNRIPEVLDCWFESGSMPYGQMHYPFENKKKFEASFPAEFIAEGQDQTRGWFYTLHVLATALTQPKNSAIPSTKKSVSAFKQVIVNGIVLAEDGKKMSKRLKNYPEPDGLLEKYGADAVRFYFISSPVMEAESLNFSEAGVREMFNKVVNTLYNVLEFYKLFQDQGSVKSSTTGASPHQHLLDKWIKIKLNQLVKEVTEKMEQYQLAQASRPIVDFIAELSQWYVRRSRERAKNGTDEEKEAFVRTLQQVLLVLAKLIAPFTPFIAEKIFSEVNDLKSPNNNSVHLAEWPHYDVQLHQHALLDEMNTVRKIVELGLALRAEHKLKVRQPLSQLLMNNEHLSQELWAIIGDELNVKKIAYAEDVEENPAWFSKQEGTTTVWLNIVVDEELKNEGVAREIIRAINQLRKEQGLTIEDRVRIEYYAVNEQLRKIIIQYEAEIKSAVLAEQLHAQTNSGKAVEIDGQTVIIAIHQV